MLLKILNNLIYNQWYTSYISLGAEEMDKSDYYDAAYVALSIYIEEELWRTVRVLKDTMMFHGPSRSQLGQNPL